ncbi:MAG: trigger factor [Fuerstiella sp.]|nr:trigger factor [Fuerstiella sp.]
MSEGQSTVADPGVQDDAEESGRLNLDVQVSEVGPCRKHVVVTVSEADIATVRSEAINELAEKAEVPGFRIGRVPSALLEKRFRDEIVSDVKQKVLLQSLEQLSDDNDIDPINQPEINVESLDIPDSGDFRYEFDVEVRPEFELPDYSSLTIERASGEVSDEEFAAYRTQFLSSHAERDRVDRAARKGDFIVCDIVFRYDGRELRQSDSVSLQLHSELRFQDSEFSGFDELMAGASVGDVRSAKLTVSLQSSTVEMRGETVEAEFTVKEVQQQVLPVMDREFLERLDCESEESLDERLREALERQIEYQQRQSTRQQVLDRITEAADWDLPESLVKQQTDNALRREMLEMSQAGFTREQIMARENEIRQNAIENTRQALKEHFVLDRIATAENIECEDSDIENELALMAFQSGESLRRIRARLIKSGMMDNMEAQLRERKAVDLVTEKISFTDVARKPFAENDVATAAIAICGNITTTEVADSDATSDDDVDSGDGS